MTDSDGYHRLGPARENALRQKANSWSGPESAVEPAFASCPDCGEGQRIPNVSFGMAAKCRRCGATLRRPFANPLSYGIVTSGVSLLLLVVAMTQDLAVVEAAGRRRTADLFAGPAALMNGGLWELSILVAFVTIVTPVLVVGLRLYTLIGLHLPRVPPFLRQAFRLHNLLHPWSMIDVFIVGYFVAYAKLGALARIEPEGGIFALFAFMVLSITTDALVDTQSIWEAIDRRGETQGYRAAKRAESPGQHVVACESCHLACEAAESGLACPRCGASVARRKHDSITRTAALAAAALVLYIPANLFPALTIVSLGRRSPSTILGGVWELAQASEWVLAAIVFLASAAVPVFKLLALATMMAVVWRGRTASLRQLTVLYRIVVVIGRWSMIDIFMESILGSLVQFGAISTIEPGGGAIAFAAVVVLTIFAADMFDPRLMWDGTQR